MAILAGLLQLKQGAGKKSLFDTDYPTIVILIVALILYSGSLIGGIYIRQAHSINLGKFMSKISLLFGALALVLELVILVPALGVASLLFWLVWFVGFVAVYSYPYVKTLFTKAVGAFERLKEYLKNMIIACCSTMNSEDPIGLPT
ncbi:hypothetical protein Pyn_18228 [Prunus yedoensis var. nudiflora]|uniref:Uncharacterized protein n=1 Tax=Prunus yedoensis var. nudiflora TaxID=2094558 RepID=A0A314XRU0_PRUYE|nr:hypothetical protein Pyn_18228 [Prunus yedoensis var. nudiflora]